MYPLRTSTIPAILIKQIRHSINQQVSIAPLVTLRILFGGLMSFGALRFMLSGWVERLYLEPVFFFKFHGFAWVQALSATGMYLLFGLMALSALLVCLGWFYRPAILLFFGTFTYVELIDATNYLNHYYLVGLLALLLFFLPAHRAFSLDVQRRPAWRVATVPAWTIYLLIAQLVIVYTCAGLAKLNPDWLLRAMPLRVWLPEHADLPILGPFFAWEWAPYLFSWAGALYDLSIAWFLLWRRTRPVAYVAVLLFHGLTWLLFNIGLFPFIMTFSTLIFFSGKFHERLLGYLGYRSAGGAYRYPAITISWLRPLVTVYLLLQLALPVRHWLYPGKVLWTEEGYRFSWRVMLVEKHGLATFYVRDSASDRRSEVVNGDYLTQFQEKQLTIQADFILQFAHFLKREYETRHGFIDPIITVNSFVALNGRTSSRFIDPTINLAEVQDGFFPKKWILPNNY